MFAKLITIMNQVENVGTYLRLEVREGTDGQGAVIDRILVPPTCDADQRRAETHELIRRVQAKGYTITAGLEQTA